MDSSHLYRIDVIDGHMHFAHPLRLGDLLRLMDSIPLCAVNLVSTPNPQIVNHNAALIYAKHQAPERIYISAGLDYSECLQDRSRMSSLLGEQVARAKTIGFDGLKLIESKPTARKRMPIPLDAPEYADYWRQAEALAMPVVWHVADPEEFWDWDARPQWAKERNWFFGDGTYPTKEALYAEVDAVLSRHSDLKVVLAHFYFMSADLERAARFLDRFPNACFDLTPGAEMFDNFSMQADAAHDFFLAYQDQILYGTDSSSRELDPASPLGIRVPQAKAWTVRTALESEGLFQPAAELPTWLNPSLEGWQGLGLPEAVLNKICRTNFQRLFGQAPATLDLPLAHQELVRVADITDQLGGDENPARWVQQHIG